jgi:uncharacterized repeat protein (TIGR03806 family)
MGRAAYGAYLLSALLATVLSGAEPVRKPYGIEQRVPWTTSRVHGTPGPEDPYTTQVAFPNVKLNEPLDVVAIPGTRRMLVAERKGAIYSFAVDKEAKPELLLDVKRTVYGVTAHPRFVDNGFIYVMSLVDPTEGAPRGSRISRFTLQRNTTMAAKLLLEKTIFEWPSGGHNGGCLRFGPDGFLYIATGDGSGIADQLETGQNPADFLASLLRIDVDHEGKGRAYAIPKDNPFVRRQDGRPEVYAYGLRQTWKFSWDSAGRLWGGDVGQDLWEEINLIEKGGNYGWSVKEGDHPFRPARKTGPTPPLPPILEQPHSEFRSITGGFVYRGARLPELRGAYIYGDYDTGKVWALKYDKGKVTKSWQLADTQLRIVAFGEDAAGEVYLLDFIGGQLHQLTTAPREKAPRTFPTKLSQTGLFASTKDHTPAVGLIPYSVNAALWSDGASKERFIALPGESQIEFETEVYPQGAPGAPPGWRFPADTVLVKTFSLEMEAGNPDSKRRLETRLLHFKPMPGTDEVGGQFWRGYTYVWNDEQTDAELLAAEGLSRPLKIKDAAAPGGVREQVWRFPSRSECTMCHTFAAKYALGVDTLQMNRDHDYGGVIANQLATLEHLGVFTKPLPKPPYDLPRLADYHDHAQPLADRARSYLHANCAHCHRKWGGGNADFQLLQTLPLAELGVFDTRPGQGDFGLKDPRILVAGDPERSLVLQRMQKTGLGRMPHIGSNVVDENAVKLIEEWIKQLP